MNVSVYFRKSKQNNSHNPSRKQIEEAVSLFLKKGGEITFITEDNLKKRPFNEVIKGPYAECGADAFLLRNSSI